MPTKTLAEKMVAIRLAAGYGGDRMQAAFAKKIGIRPPSLHAIENGRTTTLGAETLIALLQIGVNLRFITEGKGEPMQEKEIEQQLRDDALRNMIGELDEGEKDAVTDLVKGMIRRKKGSSPNDPFKQDPPGHQSGTQ